MEKPPKTTQSISNKLKGMERLHELSKSMSKAASTFRTFASVILKQAQILKTELKDSTDQDVDPILKSILAIEDQVYDTLKNLKNID